MLASDIDVRTPRPAVSGILTVEQTLNEYPSESPLTPSQYDVVLTSRFSFKSQGCVVKIDRVTKMMTVGMRFKNVGTTLVRWEIEEFQVSLNDQPPPIVIYLAKRGTVEPQENLVFGETSLPGAELTDETKGQVAFSVKYGPPQRPRAFWSKEIWNFAVTPLGDDEFAIKSYVLRDSEGES